MRLSIVLPVLDEASSLGATLEALSPLRARGVEVIVVDGGSSDGTSACAQAGADIVLTAPRGRARQMNAGAAVARGEVLLFVHADTTLPAHADALVLQAVERGAQWGRFDVRIDAGPSRVSMARLMLPVVARCMNVRSRLSGIATGDQALFVQRARFQQLGGYADQPLMEDIELSRRLRAVGPPACLRQTVLTSGRRWQTRGVWRTIFLMWRLRWRYWRGESPDTLARAYR